MTDERIYHDTSPLKEKLSGKKIKVALLSHRNPDGDAIGATLALYNIFKSMGHEANVIVPNIVPVFLQWMPGYKGVTVFEKMNKKAERIISESDLIFLVDFNELSRVKEFEKTVLESKAYKVMIDHHPGPQQIADSIFSDTSVSSSSELVFEVVCDLNLDQYIDKDVAQCIYAGIMADTGCFSYNSSNPKTFEIVSRLLSYGFDKDQIYYNVYDNFSANRLQLLGYCLHEKMKVLEKYRTAFISLSKEEMKKFQFQPGDSEGFVNYPLSIKGICFTALFTENKDYVKISFRSKGNFAVNEFSKKYFNGGGHKNAAGGESYVSLEKTLETFINLLPEFEKELLSNDA
ncbi:MAG: DHH family phosphoesterase [Bacteroidales bacterium]|nr:DHH family phosphoesterase [Bacteroidales bacterium]